MSISHYYDLCLTHKDWTHGDLRQALEFVTGMGPADMLEIGCGIGDIVSHLPTDIRFTGLDPSEYAVEQARMRYPGQSFVTGFAESLPFEEKSYDLVFSYQTVQSFRDPRRALEEIARVTRPGGYTLLISPNLECPWGAINATRHYGTLQRIRFIAGRFKDLAFRFFGHSAFRLIPESHMEATGVFERKDDDLKHVVSAWEVVRFLESHRFRDIGSRTAKRVWMRKVGPLRYYGGGMYVLLQKVAQS